MDVYTDRRHKNDLLNWLGTRHFGGTNCMGLKNITDENVMDKILQGSTNSVVLLAPYTCTQSYLVFYPHQQLAILISLVLWRPKGGGTTYNGLYREAPPKRGTFFRLEVYERVQILLVEVYERVGESVIWVCKRAQRAEQMNFMAL